MPIKRASTVSGQPAPERQSVLSFVSPSVADLLFFETVDAKTVGAGSGKTLTNSIKSTANLSSPTTDGPDGVVEGGQHTNGFSVSFTSTAHGFVVGDVVVIKDVGCSGVSLNGRHKITAKTDNTFTVFIRDDPSTISFTSGSRAYKSHPSYGTAHPDTENFPRHKLCHVKQADPEGLFFEYYYAADRLHQDDYNFEYSQADLGGNQYDTVIRTYVILRSEFDEADNKYEAGDKMPEIPAGVFPNDTYILMTRQQKRIGDAELDGLFVVEQRVYFKYEDKVSFNTDPEFNDELKTTEILAYRGKPSVPTVAGTVTWTTAHAVARANWGVKVETSPAADVGTFNYEVQRLSNDWWKIVVQQIVGKNLIDGISYMTNRNYSYPAELIGFRFTLIARRDGSEENSVVALEKDAFSGPIRMTVTRRWYANASDANSIISNFTINTYKPRSGSYSGALYSLSYSNVLTKPFTLIDTVGTGHPTYKMGAYAHNFFEQGSTPPAQPASGSIVNVAATSQQFRAGYLVETVTGVIP